MVVATGGLTALGLLAFAVVNVVFEGTGHFVDGPYAAYATGITVMNWLVIGLKVLGAGVALLSVSAWSGRVSVPTLTVLLWGAFATLAVYVLGAMGKAAALAAGVGGSADEIDPSGVGYVGGFLLLAAGFGVLAVSYSRRSGWRRTAVAAGVLGAPLLLATILVAAPALLAALGVMPSV